MGVLVIRDEQMRVLRQVSEHQRHLQRRDDPVDCQDLERSDSLTLRENGSA